MKSRLARIFDELLREVEGNPDLRARIDSLLAQAEDATASTGRPSKARNRRPPPQLDPYTEIKHGESALRQRLTILSIEQLKDIVSGYALDRSRLALKWKDHGRLVELIMTTVRSRIEKGDGFRGDPETLPE